MAHAAAAEPPTSIICLLLSCGTRAVDCVSKDVYLLGDPCAATGRRSARKQTAHELSRNTPLHHTIKLGRCVDGAEKPEVMAGQFNVGCWLGMLQATPNCIIIWGNANASVEVWSRRPMKVYPGQDGASFPGLLLLDNDTQLIREVTASQLTDEFFHKLVETSITRHKKLVLQMTAQLEARTAQRLCEQAASQADTAASSFADACGLLQAGGHERFAAAEELIDAAISQAKEAAKTVERAAAFKTRAERHMSAACVKDDEAYTHGGGGGGKWGTEEETRLANLRRSIRTTMCATRTVLTLCREVLKVEAPLKPRWKQHLETLNSADASLQQAQHSQVLCESAAAEEIRRSALQAVATADQAVAAADQAASPNSRKRKRKQSGNGQAGPSSSVTHAERRQARLNRGDRARAVQQQAEHGWDDAGISETLQGLAKAVAACTATMGAPALPLAAPALAQQQGPQLQEQEQEGLQELASVLAAANAATGAPAPALALAALAAAQQQGAQLQEQEGQEQEGLQELASVLAAANAATGAPAPALALAALAAAQQQGPQLQEQEEQQAVDSMNTAFTSLVELSSLSYISAVEISVSSLPQLMQWAPSELQDAFTAAIDAYKRWLQYVRKPVSVEHVQRKLDQAITVCQLLHGSSVNVAAEAWKARGLRALLHPDWVQQALLPAPILIWASSQTKELAKKLEEPVSAQDQLKQTLSADMANVSTIDARYRTAWDEQRKAQAAVDTAQCCLRQAERALNAAHTTLQQAERGSQGGPSSSKSLEAAQSAHAEARTRQQQAADSLELAEQALITLLGTTARVKAEYEHAYRIMQMTAYTYAVQYPDANSDKPLPVAPDPDKAVPPPAWLDVINLVSDSDDEGPAGIPVALPPAPRPQVVVFAFDYGPEHAGSRIRSIGSMDLQRGERALQLSEHMGILGGPDAGAPGCPALLQQVTQPADQATLLSFHTKTYMRALQKQRMSERFNPEDYQWEPDTTPLFRHVGLVAACAISAAAALLTGAADIAVFFQGGLHHGKPDALVGFCPTNDIVFAINRLRQAKERVMYVDIDVHQGDGVEAQYLNDCSVLTISFHHEPVPGTDDKGFYPGLQRNPNTRDMGCGYKKHKTINVPFSRGTGDAGFVHVFNSVIRAAFDNFKPGAVVMQCGCDSLQGDALAERLLLTIRGHSACTKVVRDLCLAAAVPLLVTGGGGYTPWLAARCWAHTLAVLVGNTAAAQAVPASALQDADLAAYLTPTHHTGLPSDLLAGCSPNDMFLDGFSAPPSAQVETSERLVAIVIKNINAR